MPRSGWSDLGFWPTPLPVYLKISALHPLSQLVLWRLSKLTWKPTHLLFQTIWRNSQTSSLRNPLTPCLSTSNGTMPLNWFLEKNLPVVKSIHWHLLNKRNWMHSLRKTWRPVRFVHPNLWCYLQFPLLRRRMVLST